MSTTYEGEQPRSWRSRLLRFALFLGVIGLVAGALTAAIAYVVFASGLPDLDTLEDYKPSTVTRIYDQSGQVIGELYKEKRIVVDYDQLPPSWWPRS